MDAVLRFVPPAVRMHAGAYWRWRWAMLAAAWTVAAVGWLALALVPDQYQAATRIYVDTDNLLTPLLRNITVETDLQNRLEVMQRTLLSRNNLAQVVNAAGMADPAAGEVGRDLLYQHLQKHIQVKAEGRNLFSVAYRNSDPALARRVVASLLDIFVANNVGHNRANMVDARHFIDTQIAEYEEKLKDAEGRLAEFKGRHIDILATGSSFALRLEAARGELGAARIKHREAQAARDQLRAGLANVPQYVDIDMPWQAAGPAPAPMSPAARVRLLEQQLAQLQAQYTDQHPDVTAARRALEAARAEAASLRDPRGGGTRGRAPSVVYDQLKLRQIQAEADLATAASSLQIAQENLERLSAMAKVAPIVEAELADLNREYGVLKTKYEDLLGRRESARISAAAENSSDKVQFKVIEPLYVPLVPAAPLRPLWAAAVFAAALGAAALTGFLLRTLDDTVTSAAELRQRFGVRVLGSLPRLAPPDRIGIRRLATAAGGLVAVFTLMMALSMHWHWLVPPPPGAGERGGWHDQP